MQIILIAAFPQIVYILIYIVGLISALEGQRLNIAGMTYFVYGFFLLIIADISSILTTYFILVTQGHPGPMYMIGSTIGLLSGVLGAILLIVGIRTIVSAYRTYLGTTQQM